MSQLTYNNVKRYDNMPFDEYLALPGYSHSSIKNGGQKIERTDAMQLGSLVDGILTDPGSVKMTDPQYKMAKEIAREITSSFGVMMKSLVSQVSFTAELWREVRGGKFVLPVKGRLDFLLEGFAVVDLKVTKSKDIRDTMPIFRYDNQLFHYAGLAGVPKAYLAAYSRPRKVTDMLFMNLSTGADFWAEAAAEYGTFVRAAA